MKRNFSRFIRGLILIVLMLSICYLLWPHSFIDLQPECDSITIFRFDTAEDYSFTTTKETYPADSPEFAQIVDILSRYSYHRTFRTLLGANNVEGNHAGYWIHVYLDHNGERVSFSCGGTGEILIDSLAWRVGYWGDNFSLNLMTELSSVLGK